jgi:DNA ligase 1
MKRTTLMLAHTTKERDGHYYDGSKRVNLREYLASEKLDGMRCLWDGGITYGIPVNEVPWANLAKATEEQKKMRSTGLWSRGFKPIFAPEWWVDGLPPICLDGELFMGHQKFQTLMTLTRSFDQSDRRWNKVVFYTFDSPTDFIFRDGEIDIRDVKLCLTGCQEWVQEHGFESLNQFDFERTYLALPRTERTEPIQQLPTTDLDIMYRSILNRGGEGIILRKRRSLYQQCRSHNLLKIKPYSDMEGTVIGYFAGREGKEGRHRGRMGALQVELGNGIQLKLSGFTDDERYMRDPIGWCYNNPGEQCPQGVYNPMFPIGSVVTFRYRELSDDGVPKEARYWRKRS